MKRFLSILVIIMMVISLSACGGGNGNSICGVYSDGEDEYTFAKDGSFSHTREGFKTLATYEVIENTIKINLNGYVVSMEYTEGNDGIYVYDEGYFFGIETLLTKSANAPKSVSFDSTSRKIVPGIYSWNDNDGLIIFKDGTFLKVYQSSSSIQTGNYFVSGDKITFQYDESENGKYTLDDESYYFEGSETSIILYDIEDSTKYLDGYVYSALTDIEGIIVDVENDTAKDVWGNSDDIDESDNSNVDADDELSSDSLSSDEICSRIEEIVKAAILKEGKINEEDHPYCWWECFEVEWDDGTTHILQFGDGAEAVVTAYCVYDQNKDRLTWETTYWAEEMEKHYAEHYEQFYTYYETDKLNALEWLISTIPWYDEFLSENPVDSLTYGEAWDWYALDVDENKWNFILSEVTEGYQGDEIYSGVVYVTANGYCVENIVDNYK